MTIIGITGRSGSGKSTLTAYYASKGYATIDCDIIAAQALEVGSPCLDKLAEAFGADIINPDKSLNRAKLSQRAFVDKKHQRLLNSITHPYINDMVLKKIKKAQQQGAQLIFIDVPLLVDYPLEHYCDKIVVVKAEEKLQHKRLIRRGMPIEQAKKRLATQHSNARLTAAADYVITNNGSQDEINKKAEQLLKKLIILSDKNKAKPVRRRRIPHGYKKWLPALLLFLLIPIIGLTATILNNIEHDVYRIEYETYVNTAARENNISRYLIFAVILTESGFDPDAVSNVGARGLMQITEDTFDWIQMNIDPEKKYNYDDMFDPQVNIMFGSYYIGRCLERYGYDVSTAAAAYHSGWGTVDGLLADKNYSTDGVTLIEFPFEQMNHYVDKINANYESYIKIYSEE